MRIRSLRCRFPVGLFPRWRGAVRLQSLLDGQTAFEIQQQVRCLMRVFRRAEDLVLIVLQRLHPRVQVRGVLFGVVRNAALCRKEHASEFGAEFFLRVLLRTECIGPRLRKPVESIRVAGPVAEFMQRRAIVIRR